jgi:hypothetical protein
VDCEDNCPGLKIEGPLIISVGNSTNIATTASMMLKGENNEEPLVSGFFK